MNIETVEEKHILILTGYLGLLATLVVGIGEFLIHYAPSGYSAALPYGFFDQVSTTRMTIGHFMVVCGIPFYYVGYYHLYLALKKGNQKLALALLILGVISFTIGGIWVSSRAFLGYLFHIIANENPNLWTEVASSYTFLIESLVQVLRVTILMVSVLFVFMILKYKTSYLRWMVWFNPILSLLVVFGLFFFVPVVGNFLIPTAMNVAHFILFSASLYALKRSNLI